MAFSERKKNRTLFRFWVYCVKLRDNVVARPNVRYLELVSVTLGSISVCVITCEAFAELRRVLFSESECEVLGGSVGYCI